jgi:hypothetical protein
MFKRIVTLTDAQIKALPTTSITIIPAAGAGLLIQPSMAILLINATAAAYTNLNAAAWISMQVGTVDMLGYLVNDTTITNGSTTSLSTFFGASNHHATLMPGTVRTEGVNEWGSVSAVFDPTAFVNTDLKLKFDNGVSGNLTGGDAANKLRVFVWYDLLLLP